MALSTKSIGVPHLDGSYVSSYIPTTIKNSKPTLVLINSFCSNATLFKPQFSDETLRDGLNMIAFEPFGHGNSKANSPTFTYWDSAIAFLQALEKLGVKRAFVFGISQGGYIAARMALLAPQMIGGLILASTCLDSEGQRLKAFGGPELTPAMLPVVTQLTSVPNRDFSVPDEFPAQIIRMGLGENASEDVITLFSPLITRTYSGDEGRLRLRQSTINLLSRDSLHLRLSAITCPTLWIQGTEDKMYTVENAKEELAMMGSKVTNLEVIEGGQHLLSWSHATVTNRLIAGFLAKYGGRVDARALREAVGMVEM